VHNPFDQLAKRVGKEALSACGETLVQYELSRDAQQADLRHDPDPTKNAERTQLGLLGRIAAVLCLIDVYGHAPDRGEFCECMSRHHAHQAETLRRGRTYNTRRKSKGLPPEPIPDPRLWVIAASFSAPILRELRVKRATGWPRGVYFHGGSVYNTGIVVASELPRRRSTILVRIMAAGPGLADALEDLAALQADAHERIVAEQILAHMQSVLARKPSRSPEEEEFIANMQSTWEKAKRIGRDEGKAEGKAEATAHAVLTSLRVRGVSVSAADRERILAERDPKRLERWLERAIVAAMVSEVFNEESRA
jgi:predicted nucleic acid-binding protein